MDLHVYGLEDERVSESPVAGTVNDKQRRLDISWYHRARHVPDQLALFSRRHDLLVMGQWSSLAFEGNVDSAERR